MHFAVTFFSKINCSCPELSVVTGFSVTLILYKDTVFFLFKNKPIHRFNRFFAKVDALRFFTSPDRTTLFVCLLFPLHPNYTSNNKQKLRKWATNDSPGWLLYNLILLRQVVASIVNG
ncbi:hypothetical protein T12_14855 [Trichinella patagoniensis]|uniref:Uncharacterized protein n=1 Tax=Trichinella patagoniensis TaxID=990121 RepID=A0A0V1A410_9BILA|nr:hypothetical protein T12_14855 [Trichinella patagoniensis]